MLIEESDSFFPESALSGYPRIQLGPDISVGMSAYGNSKTTREALTALFLAVEGDYELILVDDCSPDSSLDLFCSAAEFHKNTKVFAFEKNLEYSGSLNAILSHATGLCVLFISNDILVTPAYIATLLEVANHSENVGIVRGCSNFVDNGKELYNVYKDKDFDTFEELFSVADEIRERCQYALVDDAFLTGDAFLVTRKLLDSLGTLDPLFYGYFCDHDLGVRARKAGFSPVLARGAFAAHLHTANFDYLPEDERKIKSNRRWGRVYENWARFKLKYGLPVELQYSGVRNIPWANLLNPSDTQKLFEKPGNYLEYCVSVPGDSANCAANIAKRAKSFFNAARLEDGENLCRWGLRRYPDNSAILASLATILTYQCRVDEAIDLFRRALSGDEKDVKTYSSLLLAMNYSDAFTQKQIYEESCKWDEAFGLPSGNPSEANLFSPVIRIGFISGDFRQHSVSYFLEPLLECIDRSKFQIVCYSDVEYPDPVTNRLKLLADEWRDISGLDDTAVANQIRSDKVQILIDLAGHSGKRIRLSVFCLQPAPVQVSWLGYPNTTGVSAIQYRITDDIVDPTGLSDSLHTEKLIRLPSGFLCYRPPTETPELSPPPCLQNGYITFGSFNMLTKMSSSTILVWAKLLRRIKDSRLLLKCHYYSDMATAARVKKFFCDFGINAGRIELRSATSGYFEHLAAYNEVDIALDTFPYNGTTTTCEALWMGVPVVTLAGERHASRVAKSILERVGFEKLVAVSGTEYIDCAVKLAENIQGLKLIKLNARESIMKSAFCDERLYCVEFQKLLESLCFNFKKGVL